MNIQKFLISFLIIASSFSLNAEEVKELKNKNNEFNVYSGMFD